MNISTGCRGPVLDFRNEFESCNIRWDPLTWVFQHDRGGTQPDINICFSKSSDMTTLI